MSGACYGGGDIAGEAPSRLRDVKEIRVAAAAGTALAAGLVAGWAGAQTLAVVCFAVTLVVSGPTFVPEAGRDLQGRLGVGTLMAIAAFGAVVLGEVEGRHPGLPLLHLRGPRDHRAHGHGRRRHERRPALATATVGSPRGPWPAMWTSRPPMSPSWATTWATCPIPSPRPAGRADLEAEPGPLGRDPGHPAAIGVLGMAAVVAIHKPAEATSPPISGARRGRRM